MGRGVRQRDPDEALGLFVGAAFGLGLTIAALSIDAVDRWVDDRSPLPEWSGIPFAVGLLIAAIVWSVRRRDRNAAAVALALAPMMVGANAIRLIDPNPAWAETLRAVGFAFVVGVLVALGPKLTSRLKELERLLFSEASSLAFIITIAVASLYGIMEGFLGAPRISYLWLPVLGVISWVIGWALAERRHT